MAFNIFGLGNKKARGAHRSRGSQSIAATTVMDDTKPTKMTKSNTAAHATPHHPNTKPAIRHDLVHRLQILGGGLAITIASMAALVWHDNREATHGAYYVAASGEIRVLSQRIAKATTLSLQGTKEGFSQLIDAVGKTTEILTHLSNGGEVNNISLPPSPDHVRDEINRLIQAWNRLNKDAEVLIDQDKNLIALGLKVSSITNKNSPSQQLFEQFISGRRGNEQVAAQQMQLLSHRVGRNANALLLGDTIDAEVALNLSRDTATLRDYFSGFKDGNTRASVVTDAEGKKQLEKLEQLFSEDLSAITSILGNIQKLVQAKQAGGRVLKESEAVLEAAGELNAAYQKALSERTVFFVAIGLLATLSIAILALMAKAFFDDAGFRAQGAEKQSQDAEHANRTNQDAILRLMNELGDLADGDLTVMATVSEDITGAIADSINYTIEELRVLVGRINDAANRVTQATESAQHDTSQLLAATEQQSHEIQTAGRAVLEMSRSMNMVSSHATQSAQVARQSLNAAEKGAGAVQDSIKSMNEIRSQIQETSKRIKRLGESSQEIGEIVELISDITEQTNVLALNAAIQAASAGEAGRGFTVVAEEVQRLAERSGEATKQIAAIVKTIQTDTHDAIFAMEQSTQGVVQGAQLSDAAGQALAEISQVSRNLAQLIENISSATQGQAKSAASVADNMQGILQITEQTTVSTKKTATMVSELGNLANELKGSVAGFKVT